MDKAVVKAIKKPPQDSVLLLTIVAYSDGLLDPKYENIMNATALIEENTQLEKMLMDAWKKKKFRDIRNLGAISV